MKHTASIIARFLVTAAPFVVATPATSAQSETGAVLGWGNQIVGVNLESGFTAVASGVFHSLGLKTDGEIVAWGGNAQAQ